MSAPAASADSLPSQQAMANGTSPSHTGKRKRKDTAPNATTSSREPRGEDVHEIVDDLVKALETAYPIASTILSRDTSSRQPSIKRSKRSPNFVVESDAGSILAQIAAKAYQSFEEFVDDINTAVEEFANDKETAKHHGSHESDSSSPIRQARSFQQEVHALLGIEGSRKTRKPLENVSGNAETGDKASNTLKGPQGQNILTLFGTSGQGPPRQYFAGLKKASEDEEDTGVDALAASSLPNGIFTTSVLHSKGPASTKPQPSRTLKDVLPPAPQSHPYKPPPAPPSRATRSQEVEWYRPTTDPPKTRPGLKDTYADQPLIHGQWIDYLSHADTDETISEKRLKRERALSGGEGPDESELEFLQQQRNARARAKKTSLFRSAFSSFGPTRDDSNAVIPAEIKSQIWWSKVGREIYNGYADPTRELPLKQRLESLAESLKELYPTPVDETESFQEAIDAFEVMDTENEVVKQRSKEEEILEEISDSIEALLVYQQERHKILPVGGKAGASQQPSEAEFDLYDLLKSQLVLIISQLPPFVVARLDGEKLGKLNVSTQIPISVPSYSGVLEEPDKPAAAPVASASQNRPASAQQTPSGRAIYQQTSTNTPPSRPNPQPPRSVAATTSQYGNRTQTPTQYGYQSQTVQQQPRSYQYQQQQQGQTAQIPNGYRQQLQNGYQQYGQYANQAAGSPAARPPHPNQYTNRTQQGYQPRPANYQAGTASTQGTASAAPGSGSPQNASTYNPTPGRGTYTQSVSGQNGQTNTTFARPSSGSNSAAAAHSSFAIQGVKFSDEELAAIQRRQLQGSPTQPQTPVGQRPPSANGTATPQQAAAPPAPMAGTNVA